MTKKYQLTCHAGNSYTLWNLTDADPMRDYSDFYSFRTRKEAVRGIAEFLAEGHSIKVGSYGSPEKIKKSARVLELAKKKGQAKPTQPQHS